MTSPLRLLAFALLLAPSLLPAAENQRFILERPYPVAEIPEPDRSLPVTNVILMIGDGMGIHQLSAAWAANRGRLFIENCPVTGISKTWCADKLVTDSAAAGTRHGAVCEAEKPWKELYRGSHPGMDLTAQTSPRATGWIPWWTRRRTWANPPALSPPAS